MLDVKLAREGQWTQKKSTAVNSESLFQQASSETSQHLSPKTKLNTIKSKVKKVIKEDSERQRAEHAKELIKQGRLIHLLQEMEMDATWKSYLYALPKGTMKFILNSTIDTLPTKTNLKLWGLSGSDKCKLCGRKETTKHILSACDTALNQGRYTFRHNRVLKEITNNIDTNLYTFYSDLEGQTIEGGTIPPDVLVTAEKPDIVILHRLIKHLVVIELTCPWEENLEDARQRKSNKYAPLIADIEQKGFSVEYFPLEVGARGIINKANKETIKDISLYTTINTKNLIKALSKEAVTASYYIFLSRNERDWTNDLT